MLGLKLAAIAAVALPGPPPVIGPEVVARATATARAQWPASPCHGRESVIWVSQSVLDAAHGDVGVAADALLRPCVVRVTRAARNWSGPRLCALLQHEFGHLSGLRHSDDPANVMFGGTVPWTPACTRAFPPSKARSSHWSCRVVRAANLTMFWKCRPRARKAKP
jgi:hypothetical protein